MAKRPNAMGRIEADPKPKKNIPWKTFGVLVTGIVLIAVGITGTLQYQAFINNVKAEGAAEFRLDHCEKFTDEKKDVSWLECDEQAV